MVFKSSVLTSCSNPFDIGAYNTIEWRREAWNTVHVSASNYFMHGGTSAISCSCFSFVTYMLGVEANLIDLTTCCASDNSREHL